MIYSIFNHKHLPPAASVLPQSQLEPNKQGGPAKSITGSPESCQVYVFIQSTSAAWCGSQKKPRQKVNKRVNTNCGNVDTIVCFLPKWPLWPFLKLVIVFCKWSQNTWNTVVFLLFTTTQWCVWFKFKKKAIQSCNQTLLLKKKNVSMTICLFFQFLTPLITVTKFIWSNMSHNIKWDLSVMVLAVYNWQYWNQKPKWSQRGVQVTNSVLIKQSVWVHVAGMSQQK